MRKAALYVQGRIVLGDSHLEAYHKLAVCEQDKSVISGTFNTDTEEFEADKVIDHFYDKELILIRHGKSTDPNEPDPSISDEGEKQIRKLISVLQTFDLKDFVGITSPLLRCLQSSLILHELLNIDFQIQPEVMEFPFFLEEGQKYRLQNHHAKFPHFKWPTTEAWVLNKECGCEFLDRTRLALQHFPHKAIVMTHFGFIFNMARFALCGKKAEEFFKGISPASVTHINKQDIRCLAQVEDCA